MTNLAAISPVQNYRTLRCLEGSSRALAEASAQKREGIRLARHIPAPIIRLIRQSRLEMQYLQKRALKAERRIFCLLSKEDKLKNKINQLREKLDYLLNMFFKIGDKKQESIEEERKS